jgi:UDP-4-amino-4,6-dideoxy-N-acetyl-beta-L-altrosamine N-acetyltransferase
VQSPKSKIRQMTINDLQQVFQWRNDPFVRMNMFSQREIPFREHQEWFDKCNSNPDYHLLIFEDSGKPAGFVSFKVRSPSMEANWGFYRSPSSVHGVGARMGAAALLFAFEKLNIKKIWGEVLVLNKRSINFHLSMGFKQTHRPKNYTNDHKTSLKPLYFCISKHEFKLLKADV